jgi:hypothetical protein
MWNLNRGNAMAERVTVFWQGKEYDAVRSGARDGQPATSWQVLRDGSPVTSFPANPGEAASAVKEKIIGWLEGNEARPVADVGRQ